MCSSDLARVELAQDLPPKLVMGIDELGVDRYFRCERSSNRRTLESRIAREPACHWIGRQRVPQALMTDGDELVPTERHAM